MVIFLKDFVSNWYIEMFVYILLVKVIYLVKFCVNEEVKYVFFMVESGVGVGERKYILCVE